MFQNNGYVRPTRANARLTGMAGKAGQKFLEAINSFEFNPVSFAHTLVSGASETMLKRILQTFFAVVNMMVTRYDAGDMNEATTAAKRLKDCMAMWDMESDQMRP